MKRRYARATSFCDQPASFARGTENFGPHIAARRHGCPSKPSSGPFFDPQTSVGGSEDCERDLTSHLHGSDFDLSDGEGMEDEEYRRRCEPLFDGVCPLSKTQSLLLVLQTACKNSLTKKSSEGHLAAVAAAFPYQNKISDISEEAAP